MKIKLDKLSAVVLAMALSASGVQAAEGNAARGQRVFSTCMACHSLELNRSMTGPSLSGLWNRKAGSVASFSRYSPALKSSQIVWDDKTLDAWLADPQHVIPGNTMTFPGVKDAQQRSDLLAYLKQATQSGVRATRPAPGMSGMAGMMSNAVSSLKKLGPEDEVKSIAHCGDTYEVATADGKKRQFWERNLRFKTDSSEDGPTKGLPALVPAGMMGDRADVIFADPQEIAQFVSKSC